MFARNTIGHVLEVCDKILAKTPNHTALFQAARSISVEIETNFQEDLKDDIGDSDLERILKGDVSPGMSFPSGNFTQIFADFFTLPRLENFVELGIRCDGSDVFVIFSDRQHARKWHALDIRMYYVENSSGTNQIDTALQVDSVFFRKMPPDTFVDIIERWNKSRPANSPYISVGNTAVKFLVFLQETFRCDKMSLVDAARHNYAPLFNYTQVLPQLSMKLPEQGKPFIVGTHNVWVYVSDPVQPTTVYIWIPDKSQNGHVWTYNLQGNLHNFAGVWEFASFAYETIVVRRSRQDQWGQAQFKDFEITRQGRQETWYVFNTQQLDYKDSLHREFLFLRQPNQANVAKDMLFTWAATCLTWGPSAVPRLRDLAKAAIPADQLVNMAADPATSRGWIAHASLYSMAQVRGTSLPDHRNYFRLGLYCESVEADKRTFAMVYHDQQNRGVGSAQYVKMLRTKLDKHISRVSRERTRRAITDWVKQNSSRFYGTKILENRGFQLHKALQAIGATDADCVVFDEVLKETNDALSPNAKNVVHRLGCQLEYRPGTDQLFMSKVDEASVLFDDLMETYQTYARPHLECGLSVKHICLIMALEVQQTYHVSELKMHSVLYPYYSAKGFGVKFLMYSTLKKRPFIYFDNGFVSSSASTTHHPLGPDRLRERIERWFTMHPKVLFERLIVSYKKKQTRADATRAEYLLRDKQAQEFVKRTSRVLAEHRSKVQASSKPVPVLLTYFSSLEDMLYESQVQKKQTLQENKTLQELAGKVFLQSSDMSAYNALSARDLARTAYQNMEKEGGRILALYSQMKECDVRPELKDDVMNVLRDLISPDRSFIATELFYRNHNLINRLSFGERQPNCKERKAICV